jgi:hypothetical protein
MFLMHTEVARASHAGRQAEAQRLRRAHRLAAHRRWRRRAERAAMRARLALSA